MSGSVRKIATTEVQLTCKDGHPWTAQNLIADGHGHKRCKICLLRDTIKWRRRVRSRIAVCG